ncbi:MAG: hypothetical protein LBE23_14340 [Vagococcus sp.]|nr:hypothetical protein [Vagococcus sp.]
MLENIDINFNFYSDAGGKDPDKYSPTLRKYHKLLWSKKLPNGNNFILDDSGSIDGKYLYYNDGVHEYFLSSDAIGHTYSRWKRTQSLMREFPVEEINHFFDSLSNISSYIIFPSNRIDMLPTINGERGINSQICDRFDLTLECIRRYYLNEKSPLYATFQRYANFFNLFVDFKGYCDFFFLQDFTNDRFTKVKFYLPFEDFTFYPYPKTVEAYKVYKRNVLKTHELRKERIRDYINKG